MGNTLRHLGDVRSACAVYEKAIAFCERLPTDESRGEVASDLAAAYLNKATGECKLGNGRSALKWYDQAIGSYQELVAQGRNDLEYY
jgi:tetratricopeptide (TPR) repeat protein